MPTGWFSSTACGASGRTGSGHQPSLCMGSRASPKLLCSRQTRSLAARSPEAHVTTETRVPHLYRRWQSLLNTGCPAECPVPTRSSITCFPPCPSAHCPLPPS